MIVVFCWLCVDFKNELEEINSEYNQAKNDSIIEVENNISIVTILSYHYYTGHLYFIIFCYE